MSRMKLEQSYDNLHNFARLENGLKPWAKQELQRRESSKVNQISAIRSHNEGVVRMGRKECRRSKCKARDHNTRCTL
ncbi:hypothetical protein PVK06_019324 [Gossypium arboreum]|uniref:Uncharacterized protein n=1 Tax=Gossypium arboreum TaxID=29729 RepID=A0ABR0PJR8_GOSAR|nr:hypothetical protein PVK06_019324 [Gossypium arboreum]